MTDNFNIQTSLNPFEHGDGLTSLGDIRRCLRADDRESKMTALRILGDRVESDAGFGVDAVPELVWLLDSTDRSVRQHSAKVLPAVTAESPHCMTSQLPALTHCLSSEDEVVVRNIVKTMARLGEQMDGEVAVSTDDLSEALELDNETRANAYKILQHTGSERDLSELKTRVDHEPGYVGEACRKALHEIELRKERQG